MVIKQAIRIITAERPPITPQVITPNHSQNEAEIIRRASFGRTAFEREELLHEQKYP